MATRDYANKSKNKAYKNSSRRSDRSARSSSDGSRDNRSVRSKPLRNWLFIANISPMMFLVLVIGAIFITSIIYLEYAKGNLNKQQIHKVVKNTVSVTKANIKATQNKFAKQNTDKPEKRNLPRFEFYHTLPKMEVAVEGDNKDSKSLEKNKITGRVNTDKQSNKSRPNEIKIANKSNTGQSKYSLQLASFRDYNDAEEFKVKLILSGFDVIIQTIKLENEEVWHRVKSKKLIDLAQADDLSAKLKKININSMLVVDKT